MTVESIVLREIQMRLRAPFETSFGVTHDRRILLVEAVVNGISGWGEVTTIESLPTTPKPPIPPGSSFPISLCLA